MYLLYNMYAYMHVCMWNTWKRAKPCSTRPCMVFSWWCDDK